MSPSDTSAISSSDPSFDFGQFSGSKNSNSPDILAMLTALIPAFNGGTGADSKTKVFTDPKTGLPSIDPKNAWVAVGASQGSDHNGIEFNPATNQFRLVNSHGEVKETDSSKIAFPTNPTWTDNTSGGGSGRTITAGSGAGTDFQNSVSFARQAYELAQRLMPYLNQQPIDNAPKSTPPPAPATPSPPLPTYKPVAPLPGTPVPKVDFMNQGAQPPAQGVLPVSQTPGGTALGGGPAGTSAIASPGIRPALAAIGQGATGAGSAPTAYDAGAIQNAIASQTGNLTASVNGAGMPVNQIGPSLRSYTAPTTAITQSVATPSLAGSTPTQVQVAQPNMLAMSAMRPPASAPAVTPSAYSYGAPPASAPYTYGAPPTSSAVPATMPGYTYGAPPNTPGARPTEGVPLGTGQGQGLTPTQGAAIAQGISGIASGIGRMFTPAVPQVPTPPPLPQVAHFTPPQVNQQQQPGSLPQLSQLSQLGGGWGWGGVYG